ncbi:MAG TPA: CBS domain-containing protein [Cryomorphaceae bacterium]|nr:CBS domain-containing protein [Cryomorphaceae bacterium]
MVKNYMGVRKKEEKVLPQKLVRDVMRRNVTTFRPDQLIGEVTRTMMEKGISGGPVLDASGKLIGMISEGDCLKQMVRGKYTNSVHDIGRVGEHMAAFVYTVSPEENVLDVARKFLELKVRRFPVLEDGKLVGQISQRGVMRALDTLQHRTL